ncbi:MAG: transcription elongation factor NusA [Candidatus Baldrarchaeia archaeon]
MKTPLCTFCLKSGILCPKCQEKVEKGEVSELDIKIAKELLELESRFPALKDVEFKKSIEIGPLIIILVGEKDVSSVIGPNGKIVKILSGKLNKKIRVVGFSSDIRKTIQDLLAPAEVLGVNIVWLPDGSYEKKVRVRRSDVKRLPADVKTLENAIQCLLNERFRIVLE